MGLDMYLSKRTYVGANYDHNKITGKIGLKKDGKPININSSRITYIEEQVGYWRKANQIHKWFVDNVQDGKDDCRDYYVSKEKVLELLALCQKVKSLAKMENGVVVNGWSMINGKRVDHEEDGIVIENAEEIAELLPNQSGFFFGSTDYDESYMRDIDSTIEILNAILAESDPSKEYFDFNLQYQSSW